MQATRCLRCGEFFIIRNYTNKITVNYCYDCIEKLKRRRHDDALI